MLPPTSSWILPASIRIPTSASRVLPPTSSGVLSAPVPRRARPDNRGESYFVVKWRAFSDSWNSYFCIHCFSPPQAFIYGGPLPINPATGRRARTKIRTPQDVIHRKMRKNSQSRARAALLRKKVEDIKAKPSEAKTQEEEELYQTVEQRRARKNNRSKERALEKKAEADRIMAKPESERTKEEAEFLNTVLEVKRRKNEGDRLRRERLKSMGLKAKPPGVTVSGRKAGMMPPLPPGAQPLERATPVYPPPPQPYGYYNVPPPMDDDHSEGSHAEEGDDGEEHGSATTEQEMSELLLGDDPVHPDNDDDAGILHDHDPPVIHRC